MSLDISTVPISAVWRALGGGELQHGRGTAFWRRGDGYNVSLKDDTHQWYDFVAGEGGGVIDLIRTAHGCSKREAAKWYSETFGIPLEQQNQTPRQRRQLYKDRRARRETVELWRYGVWARLRAQYRENGDPELLAKIDRLDALSPHEAELVHDAQPAGRASADLKWARANQKAWDAIVLRIVKAVEAEARAG